MNSLHCDNGLRISQMTFTTSSALAPHNDEVVGEIYPRLQHLIKTEDKKSCIPTKFLRLDNR